MLGRGAVSLAKPPRCIAPTKHLLPPLMPLMHVWAPSTSNWWAPFPRYKGNVSPLHGWINSIDSVKQSLWLTVTPRPTCSILQPIAAPSLNQRISSNASEKLHITQLSTKWKSVSIDNLKPLTYPMVIVNAGLISCP